MSRRAAPSGGATLLCGPGTEEDAVSRAYRRALAEQPGRVVWVSYTRPVAACHRDTPESIDAESVGVLRIGGRTGPEADDGQVEVLEAPDDLTGLGIRIDGLVTDEEPTTVCFDSVTALLQYVETQQAYEFFHWLTGRLWQDDARGLFRYDPTAHDQRTTAVIQTVFDERISCSSLADGSDSVA